MTLAIRKVDYTDAAQAEQLVCLLDAYARDPMGGGEPLTEAVRAALVGKMGEVAGAVSFIAYADGEPVGLLNAFRGFSTFAAKPLYNIHDLAVLPQARGKGVGAELMQALEVYARAQGCCKITLEVLTGNVGAKALYAKQGYSNYQLDPSMGQAELLQKYL